MASRFILDASVTIRWALQDGSSADRTYADGVLDSFEIAVATVPALWTTEIVHVLRCAEDAGKFGESALAGFLYRLGQLPIELDAAAPLGVQLAVAAVSREFKLSGYDAQYLELARRLSLPIATLDKDLRKAARKAGVPIYLVQ
jgi:predicted nucleic acid-binding protein